jgi:hypothetical protein
MTLKEQLYQFPNLDIHASIIMQMSIESRLMTIIPSGEEPKKEQKAVIDELSQLYDDLDRHLAAIVRRQEYEQIGKNNPSHILNG